jgi:hypothetical protein
VSNSQDQTTKPLGRWHRWWLRQFRDAWAQKGPQQSGGICVAGYDGTAQGRALAGLMDRGLIAHRASFGSGAAILTITEQGLAHAE